MKNLLITGGCGFIGSNFINYIHSNYDDISIFNLDAMYYCASEENVNENVRNSDNYKLLKGNLCNYDFVYYILETFKIDTIIHFAAQSHVQNSFDDSLQYTKDNVLGTHTLLEATRIYNNKTGNISKIIHISTDEVYGESFIDVNEVKKNENSILCPTNPYAATKAAAEFIASSYKFSFNLPIIITRGNNVYGPNQYPEKLIPRFIKLLKEGQKVTIQGDGSCVRAFLHASDVATAIELIISKGEIGEIYNIGSDDDAEYTVKDVAEILINLINGNNNYEEYIEYIEDRPFNDQRYYISNEKLKNLGWEIKKEFMEGLIELI